jgi:hypothetical protein
MCKQYAFSVLYPNGIAEFHLVILAWNVKQQIAVPGINSQQRRCCNMANGLEDTTDKKAINTYRGSTQIQVSNKFDSLVH